MTQYDVGRVLETWAKRQGVAVEVDDWRPRSVLVTVTRAGGGGTSARVVTTVLDLDAVGGYTAVQWGALLGELSRRAGINSVDVSEAVALAVDPRRPASWANGAELRMVRHGEGEPDGA